MITPPFGRDCACLGALSGRILFGGRFSHGVAMGWKKIAPCGALGLAEVRAGILKNPEQMIHGMPVANHPENSYK
jgi:hypothetical protein